MAITKEQIVAEALEMLEADGLERLSLRRLAMALGVKAPAIYWHVPSKRALLDEMVHRLVAPAVPAWAPPADPSDWDAWLVRAATALRQALLSVPGAAGIAVGAGLGRAAHLGLFLERCVEVLHAAGFTLADASRLAGGFNAFVLGRVAEESSIPGDLDDEVLAHLRVRYPALADGLAERRRDGSTADADFDILLGVWVDGARARLERGPEPGAMGGAEPPATS